MLDLKELIQKEKEEYDGENREKLRRRIVKIINGELTVRERAYFLLSVLEERKIKEIAEIKEVSTATVSKALKNAKRKIRNVLNYLE